MYEVRYACSNIVREIEMQLGAYEKIVEMLKGTEVPSDVFIRNISAFRTAKRNRVLGYCPFPYNCSEFEQCREPACNADECSDGYAYRRS